MSNVVRSLMLALAVLGAAVASLLALDRVNRPPRPQDPGIEAVDTSRNGRLLVLHLDSWRYETAMDSLLMPQVAALRRRGATWQVQTVFEGFTVPAVRAAFTGHAETQLVNVIQNFRFRALPMESFFLDASRIGKQTLAVAVEPWQQFGELVEQRAPVQGSLDMYAADRLRPDMALRAFRDEPYDVVICHYESADWVAHEVGIRSPRYRAEFAYADSLVARFAAAIGPQDYLLVYGDHGHSPTGEHKTGIEIPTYALLLGPDVTPGVVAAPLPMTDLRFVVSHAMGITLRSGPYSTTELGRFLPIASSGAIDGARRETRASRSVADYAIAFVVLTGAVALAWWLVQLAPGATTGAASIAGFALLFAAELLLQRSGVAHLSLFPLIVVALAAGAKEMPWPLRAAVTALGLWFAVLMTAGGVAAPAAGVAPLIVLYVAAIASKLLVYAGVVGRGRWAAAVCWTAVTTVVGLRVWDSPWACAGLLAAAIVVYATTRDPGLRRAAQIAALSALVYFTLRAPLYHLAWFDLFFAALWLLAAQRDDAWIDTLVISGCVALTSGWLASSLEWGFLYTLFPAHLVELQVQYFLPAILIKLPLPMLLAFAVIGRRPTRRFVQLLLTYAAVRFGAGWALRLGGASGAEIWPYAEEGLYLTTFVVAAVLASRTRQHARPAEQVA